MKVGDVFFKKDGKSYIIVEITNGIATKYEELTIYVAKNFYYEQGMSVYDFLEDRKNEYMNKQGVNVFK